MADRYGVLASSSAVAVGTTTVYTCPSGKAAKVKLQMLAQGGAASVIFITSGGATLAASAAFTAGHYLWTARGGGLFGQAAGAALPDGLTALKTCAPADQIYYLSAGHSIQFVISGAALQQMNFQVVGTEVQLS
jgi:hypothetical protein